MITPLNNKKLHVSQVKNMFNEPNLSFKNKLKELSKDRRMGKSGGKKKIPKIE